MKKLLLLCLFLTGCVGGISPQATFYTLQPMATSTSNVATTIGVERVNMPRYLDRDQIVTQENFIMTVSENHRWVEPLPKMTQRVFVADLANALPKSVVKMQYAPQENFDVLVQVDITQMDGTFGDKAVLQGWITLQKGNHSKRFAFQESLPLQSGYDDLMTAQSKLLATMAQSVAKQIS